MDLVPTAATTFYADLHVHSRYSRATSKHCDLEHLAYWASRKGIAVVGTGDFTHPAWRAELRDKLVPAEPGLFRLRDDIDRAVRERLAMPAGSLPRFLLSVEISTIYKKGDKTRKIHHLIYAPDLDSVDRMVARLAKIGNLYSDGRPILGLDSRDLLEIVLDASEQAYLVPAHVWTPWFAVLGSKSGFDQVAECYGDLAGHVFAIETGLSSDPPMNWRLSALDRYTLMSSSDAHSPGKLGREACVFETEIDYFAMRRALETRQGYGGTVEFFPEEGKYHLDGHRKCNVMLEPAETRALDGRCPVCGQGLTIGVMHRVQELADRADGVRPEGAPGFRNLVPLSEVLSEILGAGEGSQMVDRAYEGVLSHLGSELFILDQAPIEELRRGGNQITGQLAGRLAEAVARMRAGQVIRQPGYDGEYGVIRLFADGELGRGKAVSLSLALPEPAASTATAGGGESGPAPGERAGALASRRADSAAVGGAGEGDARDGHADEGGADGRAGEGGADGRAGEGGADGRAGEGGDEPTSARLAALDPDQRRAAACVEGPLLIIAGPGTGKTRTLTHRIAHLVADCGVPPEACLAITFTNRAAEEMRERLHALLPALGERVLVQTFHALALRILRENRQRAGLHRGFRVATEAERIALLAETLCCTERKARSVLARIARLERAGTPGAVAAASADGSEPVVDAELLQARDAYRAALDRASLLDFDELLVRAVALLGEDDLRSVYRARFLHVSIDEYQDIDELQYRMVTLLAGHAPTAHEHADRAARSLCAIGDPDQAIYGFRGADVRFFLRFREDFAGAREIHLTRNYRSTVTIVDAALQAIAPSSLVADRVLQAVTGPSRAGAGEATVPPISIVVAASERAEAETVVHTIETLVGGTSFFSLDSGRVGHAGEADLSFSDFAVLYRTAAQAGPLCEALARSGIPFQVRSHARLADEPLVLALVERMRASLSEGLAAIPDASAAIPDGLAAIPEGLAAILDASAAPLVLALQHAAAALARAMAEPASEIPANSGDEPLAGGPQLEALVDMLKPLAQRCGADIDRFLTELAMDSEIDLWDARADRVSLLTLHAAKGLEFRVVFMVGCEDGILPMRWSLARAEAASSELDRGDTVARPGDSDDEERRLFFVGMTRAREWLYLLHARKRRWRGSACELPLSPFVRVIEEHLLTRQSSRGKKRAPAAHEQLGLF
jgi:DNA helicase-2/ATP-dependent DNA helicase PcrA